jgi:hypothetical protein
MLCNPMKRRFLLQRAGYGCVFAWSLCSYTVVLRDELVQDNTLPTLTDEECALVSRASAPPCVARLWPQQLN